MRTQERWAVGALGFIAVVTGAWWALALWPLPSEAPQWLERARAVCFNTGPSGLPDASGWTLLIGQPLGMLGILWAGWGAELRAGLRALAGSRTGRAWVGATALLGAVAVVGAGVRVAAARPAAVGLSDPGVPPSTYPRLDRSLPDMSALVDQHGRAFDLAALEGRGALVTFAFAHCEAVCPLVVRSALEVRDELRDAGESELAVVALTLDPWRDTPALLAGIAEQWTMGAGDLVLGGDVEAVQAALDAWNVARTRDERTGDVVHPALVYLVEPDGTVAYASTGGPAQLRALALRLRGRPVSGGSRGR